MAGTRRCLAVALFTCGVLTALAAPAAASAASGLVTGFSDPLYTSDDSAQRAAWLDRTVESKAGIVRINISWLGVAGAQRPSDPSNPASSSYDLSRIDAGVRAAAARGLLVLLTVESAPAWAEAAGRPSSVRAGTWKPSPSDLAGFAQALAARYSGRFDPDGAGPAPTLPAAYALQIWNEPNLQEHLTPQYEGKTLVSASHYREMLNASYSAVKAVNPEMLVVTGGTAPYGDAPGGGRTRPVTFLRQLLSATSTFDILAHHPINTAGKPRRSAINPNDASSPDLKRISRVLRAAERAGRVLPAGPHPIWATELWWDSNPPNPAGVPLGRQARWLEEALYLLWKRGASVVVNLVIGDFASPPANARTGDQSGIFFADGQPKPAFTAWRFPFVTERAGKGAVRAWGKAPASGTLRIERRAGNGWRAIKALGVSAGGVFTARLHLGGRARVRAAVAGETSLTWTQK